MFYHHQALHAQYQQVAQQASGLHTAGLDTSQQINPALAPFMMMPSMFASSIPPTSMAVLSHFNQVREKNYPLLFSFLCFVFSGGCATDSYASVRIEKNFLLFNQSHWDSRKGLKFPFCRITCIQCMMNRCGVSCTQH